MTQRPSSPVPVKGWELKVHRAQDHLQWISTELEWFRQGDPYDVVSEFDAETAENRVIISHVTAVPLEWSTVIGDCIQNLRSALDHTIWFLSKRPTRKTEFPLFDDPDKFKRDSRKKIGSISPDAQTIVQGLQPYHRRDANPAHPVEFLEGLWLLHEFSNIDKHRTVHLTASVLAGSTLRIKTEWIDFADQIPPGPLEPGTVIANIPSDSLLNLDLEVDVGLHFGVGVAFKEGPGAGRDVLATLTTMAGAVSYVIEQLANSIGRKLFHP